MATILIDTENISLGWIPLLKTLTKTDYLLLFYTANSASVPLSQLQEVLDSITKTNIQLIPCCSGTNALDFQLVTELGFRIANNHQEKYIIASKDHGFDAVVSYWKKSGVNLFRVSQWDGSTPVISPEQSSLESSVSKEFQQFIPVVKTLKLSHSESISVLSMIERAFKTAKTHPFSTKNAFVGLICGEVSKDLSATFGPNAGKDLYKELKAKIIEYANKICGNEMNVSEKIEKKLLAAKFPKDKIHQMGVIVEHSVKQKQLTEMYYIYDTMLKSFGQKEGLSLYRSIRATVREIVEELEH